MPFETRKVPVNQKETTKLLHNITQIMNHLSVQSRFFILGKKIADGECIYKTQFCLKYLHVCNKAQKFTLRENFCVSLKMNGE